MPHSWAAMNALTLTVVILLAAGAASVRVFVSPKTVSAGGAIRLTATASPCRSADTVTAISAVFPGHAFGEGALTSRVNNGGAFTIRGHVRTNLRAGRYTIGFRCGGGNLGVTVTVRVR